MDFCFPTQSELVDAFEFYSYYVFIWIVERKFHLILSLHNLQHICIKIDIVGDVGYVGYVQKKKKWRKINK